MSEFNVYIMSVVGAVCLGSLTDIVLPEGETKKYVKGIIALIVFAIMISPIPKLVNRDFKLSDFIVEDSEYSLSSAYSVADVERAYLEKEALAVKILEANGYPDAVVTILLRYDNNMPVADKAIVVLSGTVISKKDENIDIISEAKRLTSTATGIGADDIIVENCYEQDQRTDTKT